MVIEVTQTLECLPQKKIVCFARDYQKASVSNLPFKLSAFKLNVICLAYVDEDILLILRNPHGLISSIAGTCLFDWFIRDQSLPLYHSAVRWAISFRL